MSKIANLSCGHSQEVPSCCEVDRMTACDECTELLGEPCNSQINSCFSLPSGGE